MKIGILTFHDANNYGAVLQAYALTEAVKKIESDVEIINYKLFSPLLGLEKECATCYNYNRNRGL
jgi:hypothetical protein